MKLNKNLTKKPVNEDYNLKSSFTAFFVIFSATKTPVLRQATQLQSNLAYLQILSYLT